MEFPTAGAQLVGRSAVLTARTPILELLRSQRDAVAAGVEYILRKLESARAEGRDGPRSRTVTGFSIMQVQKHDHMYEPRGGDDGVHRPSLWNRCVRSCQRSSR